MSVFLKKPIDLANDDKIIELFHSYNRTKIDNSLNEKKKDESLDPKRRPIRNKTKPEDNSHKIQDLTTNTSDDSSEKSTKKKRLNLNLRLTK